MKKFIRNAILFQFENKPFMPDLVMSKTTLLTYTPLSKDVEISWVIDNSWLIQESRRWKPDSVFQDKFISGKMDKNFVKIRSFKYFTTYRK